MSKYVPGQNLTVSQKHLYVFPLIYKYLKVETGGKILFLIDFVSVRFSFCMCKLYIHNYHFIVIFSMPYPCCFYFCLLILLVIKERFLTLSS